VAGQKEKREGEGEERRSKKGVEVEVEGVFFSSLLRRKGTIFSSLFSSRFL